MRRWAILLLGLLLSACSSGAWAGPEAPPVPAEHVLMLDVSGSMGQGGYGDSTRFSEEIRGLLGSLLAPDGRLFRPQDPLILQPFSDPQTEQVEGRTPLEGQDLQGLGQALDSLPGPGGGATDLKVALERAMHRPRTSPVRLYWILTDNENNFQGQRSDEPFYLLLRDAPELRNVYFIPLAAPRSADGSPGTAGERAGALVLYLAVASEDADVRWLEPVLREVESRLARSLGFTVQAVLFRPLYVRPDQPVLDVGQKVFSDPGKGLPPDRWPVAARDASRYLVSLRLQPGGEVCQGRLRFTFLSRLDGWRIQKARLAAPRIRELGAARRTEARLDRRILSVEPRQESADSYLLTFTVPRSPSGNVPPLNADVELQATVEINSGGGQGNLEPAVDPETLSRMAQVKELFRILDLMLHQGGSQTSDVRTFTVRLPVRLVGEGASSGLGLAGLALLGMGILGVVLLGWLAAGRRFRLQGPDGEEFFRLGGFFRSHRLLSQRGVELGLLVPGPRGPRVLPSEGVLVEGEASPLDLEGRECEFVMQPPGGGATRFLLEAGSSAPAGESREEGPAL